MQHFHEALGEVNRAVEEYDLVRDTFLVKMWSVGYDTLAGDFARLRKKNRHIWPKAEQAVRTTAKKQRACKTATKKVYPNGEDSEVTQKQFMMLRVYATERSGQNSRLGQQQLRRHSVSDLVTAAPNGVRHLGISTGPGVHP